MLRELRIKNFAVIDEAALELGPGLNVLTGETGAGKSIILNALEIVSGDRVTSDLIRHGEDEATVEALFEEVPEAVKEKLREASFAVDDELVIKRIVSRSGRNRIYVGGGLCPLSLLSDISSSMVHIYGQHEHHALLKPETHMGLLDAFAGLGDRVSGMSAKFHTMDSVWQSLSEARALLEKRKKEKRALETQAEEIVNARLRPGEEEELQAKKNVLLHAEKLYQGCLEGQELLYEGESAMVSRLGRYGSKLKELAAIDRGLQPVTDLVEAAVAQLEEANTRLRRYAERVHFEPGALEQLEDRLAEIHRLKRKYNGSVEDILRIQAEVESQLKSLQHHEEEIPALERTFEAARQTAWETAGVLGQERQKAAKQFKREMEKEVKSLGMPETVFEVRFFDLAEKEDDPPYLVGGKKLTEQGSDQIEFYFSPNPGEPPKPLAKIASGGELSRLMLAMKSLVLSPGDIPTLLFDEVDAGVGGGVAEIVGKKLKQVAAAHQVVRKEISRGRTSTKVNKLQEQERVEEIARMLGGVKITDRTIRHAEEMV